MFAHRLFVTPIDSTLNYLYELCRTSTLPIDIDSFHVDIMISESPMEANPNAVYTAQAGSANIWYDPVIGSSSFILPLYSPSMFVAWSNLQTSGITDAFYPAYRPYMVLKYYMPGLTKRYRASVNAISMALTNLRDPLVFSNETVVYEEFKGPPAYDFYQNAPIFDGQDLMNSLRDF